MFHAVGIDQVRDRLSPQPQRVYSQIRRLCSRPNAYYHDVDDVGISMVNSHI